MGLAAFQMKDFATSHAEFDAYQRLLPGNPGMYFLDNLGRRQEAAILYRRYLETGASDQVAVTAQKRLAAIQ